MRAARLPIVRVLVAATTLGVSIGGGGGIPGPMVDPPPLDMLSPLPVDIPNPWTYWPPANDTWWASQSIEIPPS